MILLDGSTLTVERVLAVARDRDKVALAPAARRAIERSHRALERIVRRGEPAYGITTGFGELERVRIPPSQVRELQVNLIRSHAVGTGAPLPSEAVRAGMLIRANALAKGYSGVRVEVVQRLVALLNRVPVAIERQRSLEEGGDRVCSTTVSLGELYFGAFNSRHVRRNLGRLSRIRHGIQFLPFDVRAAIEFGRVQQETRSRGTPIPSADAMIAAIARARRLRVLSHDEHFRWVPRLRVEDWLA